MKALIAVLAVVAAGAASGQSRPPLPVMALTEADDRRTVRLPVGAQLTVRLPEQAGTAYEWRLRDDDRIREIGDPKVQNVAPPGIVGGTKLRIFRIQLTAGGQIPLVFQLRSIVPGTGSKPVRRVVVTIEASSMPRVPQEWQSPATPAQIIGEREADGIVSTRQGQLIELHLPADPSTGYSWEVLSSRNIAFEGPVGVEHRPGVLGGLVGRGAMTVIRLRTTVIQADGFLTMAYMPPGQRPDRDRAVRMLSYQFNNKR